MKKLLVGSVALLGLTSPALAQSGANYSAITSAVDFTTAIAAMMAVAAIVALPLIARKGIRWVLGALK
jgi:hypothetical protein